MSKNYALDSGERQTGSQLTDIRYDHIARYDLAIEIMRERRLERGAGYDVFCGNGYGAFLICQTFPGINLVGVDGSKEAVDMANQYYQAENNLFCHKLYPFSLPQDINDIVVCFESLEHVEDDGALLISILKSLKDDGVALISVPNQSLHPLEKNPHEFHYRHYLHEDFVNMLPDDYEVAAWYGQDVYEFTDDGVNTFRLLDDEKMRPKMSTHGQVNIYIVHRSEKSNASLGRIKSFFRKLMPN